MLCPKCQIENPEASKFCINCGVSLTTPTQTSPQVPPQTPPPRAEVSQTPPPSKAWYEKWWGILLLVLLTGPIGMLIIYLILKKTSLSQNVKVILAVIIGFIFFSFSIYLGLQMAGQKEATQVPVSTPSVKYKTPTPTSTPLPLPPVTLLQTVGTEFQGVEASLTKIERGINMVTANFTFTATGETKYSALGTPIMDPSLPYGEYDLGSAYLIDDASQMKYEVMKDATGKTLASLVKNKDLKKGQSVSVYAQFTAPPETTKTVTIVLPMVQPFTGVSLE